MVQWLRIFLPMLGTRIRSLVGEESTSGRANRTACHKYWAQVLETASRNFWSLEPGAQAPQEKPALNTARESPYTATKTHNTQKQLNECIIFKMLPEKEKGLKKKKRPHCQLTSFQEFRILKSNIIEFQRKYLHWMYISISSRTINQVLEQKRYCLNYSMTQSLPHTNPSWKNYKNTHCSKIKQSKIQDYWKITIVHKEMGKIYSWVYGHEFEQALGDGEGQGSLGCCSPWGLKESVTEQQQLV